MTRTPPKRHIAGGVICLSLLLAGCTTSETPATTGVPATAQPQPVETTSPASLAEGVADAEQAMARFATRDRSYGEWWAALSPMLTNDALAAYADTNPAQIPPSQVTGAGVVASAPSFNRMSVLVPTDVGQYTVELVRQSDDNPATVPSWLVDRITPPAELG